MTQVTIAEGRLPFYSLPLLNKLICISLSFPATFSESHHVVSTLD